MVQPMLLLLLLLLALLHQLLQRDVDFSTLMVKVCRDVLQQQAVSWDAVAAVAAAAIRWQLQHPLQLLLLLLATCSRLQ